MKTRLPLALLAATALSTGALAQATAPGSGTATTTITGNAGAPSPSTGANSGSGSPGDPSAGSSMPGSQSPNPNVDGGAPGRLPQDGSARGQASFGGQPMLQGMMTCVSPAPMGGFGSFACYPAGWGMAMGMNGMGWHPRMMHGQWEGDSGPDTPNGYYQDRQTYHGKRNRSRVPGWDSGGSSETGTYDDNDLRNNTGRSGYDDNSGSDDYSNQ